MSDIRYAYKIDKNSENNKFVDNPYIPIQIKASKLLLMKNYDAVMQTMKRHSLTVARCMDIKNGNICQ